MCAKEGKEVGPAGPCRMHAPGCKSCWYRRIEMQASPYTALLRLQSVMFACDVVNMWSRKSCQRNDTALSTWSLHGQMSPWRPSASQGTVLMMKTS
eukprot:1160276-Pelagomonas_calceolata.AAC.20